MPFLIGFKSSKTSKVYLLQYDTLVEYPNLATADHYYKLRVRSNLGDLN